MTVPLSRRVMIQSGLAAAAQVAMSHELLAQATKAPSTPPAKAPAKKAATPAPAAAPVEPSNRFGRMVHDHYVQKIRAVEKASLKRKATILSRADAEAYVQEVREKIRRCFGPDPERTPLNPRITGTVERDTYIIEKVIFESRPNFPVTANLYIPKGRTLPAPGIIGSCGHSAEGKGGETYQSFAQGLARLGYVVLIYDPMGQGERMQLVDEHDKPRFRGGTAEHLYAGNPQFLVGEFFGSWRAWDGVRALDYLLTRPEVDQKHIGITGNSGGGTMTTWIVGLDHRYTMAAPGCFVTTVRRDFENELPQDTEQCPPRMLAQGLDHDDFIAAMKGRPAIILAKERDFFDVRGSEEAYGRLRRVYRLLSREKNIQLFTGPTPHGYSQENREAMYRFFNGVTGVSDATSEPPITIEKQETLWCTPSGQVAELKPRNLVSFTAEKSRELAKRRGEVSGTKLVQAVRQVLKLPARVEAHPEYNIIRPGGKGYPSKGVAAYAVETEPGIQIVVTRLGESLVSRPTRGASRRAVLYVSDRSADAELRDEPLIRQIMEEEKDATIYAMDPRGVGESRPTTTGSGYDRPYGADYFYAAYSLMLDEPYIGRKTLDVLRVIEFLVSERGGTHGEVHVVGRGWGAIPAAYAALLSEAVKQVTLKHALTSYSAIAESEHYDWPLSIMATDVLRHFDLPDVYRALSGKGLKQVEPRNERNQPA